MISTPKVSVIIPIYNVGDYLGECLDSIVGQTLNNLEIICVNDGSTDSSLSIMRKYAADDNRIAIIDKPNAGYGHSVNMGLDRASGDWISIIEPDDFVKPCMYEQMLHQATLSNGNTADIVKSSYWLYFDLGEGTDSYTAMPNVMNHMPAKRMEFNVFEHSEIMKHHPSIWSAIYRRDFIEKHGIRMIEPKGAGWADNPWFFETMLQAQNIVWTPCAYYYYRQTNPNASSVLKDFHMPFERLRDIRGIYERLNVVDRDLLIALHQRTFNYTVDSILKEFGFPESDPELFGLIEEAFESMDPKLVLSDRRYFSTAYVDYYKDVMGVKASEVKEHEVINEPTISVIMPIKDDHRGFWRTVASITKQNLEGYEVILIDCGTRDRTMEAARALAEKDKRFRILDEQAESVGAGYAAGLAAARASYVSFIRPGVIYIENSHFKSVEKVLQLFSESCIDVILTDLRLSFIGERLPREPEKILEGTACDCANISRADYLIADDENGAGIAANISKYPGIGIDDNAIAWLIDCTGVEAEIALSSELSVYTKTFRRDFLLANEVLSNHSDDDGFAISVKAVSQAKRAALVNGLEVRSRMRENISRRSIRSENDLIAFEHGIFESMQRAASEVDTPTALKVAQACTLCRMAYSIELKGYAHSGERYYEALRKTFQRFFSMLDSTDSAIPGYRYYLVLENAFATTCERFSVNEDESRRHRVENLQRTKENQKRRIRRQKAKIKRLKNAANEKAESRKVASKSTDSACDKVQRGPVGMGGLLRGLLSVREG